MTLTSFRYLVSTYKTAMDTVKQIRARFESASSLDQMSESPRLKKTNSLKAIQLVNGTNEPSSPSLPTSPPPPRVPPPVPPKRKISKETIAIRVTEENDTGKQLQDQEILDALRKEKCDLEKEIALLKKESREDKKKLKRYEHKLDHFEASCKARRVSYIYIFDFNTTTYLHDLVSHYVTNNTDSFSSCAHLTLQTSIIIYNISCY